MLIDISHAIETGMITYRGLPGPVISDHLSREDSRKIYAAGVEFQIGRIEMVANTGTYVDSPFHRYEHGIDLAGLPLSSLCNVDGVVFRVDENQLAVDVALFQNRPVKDKAVLIHTGWDRHWRTDQYPEGHPYLTKAAAEFLANSGAIIVGIDSFNIDDTKDFTRPAHSILLAAQIPIVEHLCNLKTLPDDGFHFFAVPPKVKGLGTFPVRAFCIVS
jgi:kynurenine formamidase